MSEQFDEEATFQREREFCSDEPRTGVVPIGAATVGVGALLFASGNSEAASIGRLPNSSGANAVWIIGPTTNWPVEPFC